MLQLSENLIECHEEFFSLQSMLPPEQFANFSGLYVATQSPLGWYGREKPAAGGILLGLASLLMGWDQSPVDSNGMGRKLLCVVMG